MRAETWRIRRSQIQKDLGQSAPCKGVRKDVFHLLAIVSTNIHVQVCV